MAWIQVDNGSKESGSQRKLVCMHFQLCLFCLCICFVLFCSVLFVLGCLRLVGLPQCRALDCVQKGEREK